MTGNKLQFLGLVLVGALGYSCQIEKSAESPKGASGEAAASHGPRPRPNRVVLGYSYTGNDAKWPPESYDYGSVTHITRCFLPVKEDGSMNDNGIFDPKLTELARKNGVKLLASVGGWMGEHGDEPWLKMARDPKSRQRFFDNLDRIITAAGYDGIDIDWEPIARQDLKPAEVEANQKTFAEFVVALRARFPKWILTAAIQPGPFQINHVSWKEVVASLDYINMMTYDYHGPWTKHAAHNANLYPTSDFVNKEDLDIDGTFKVLVNDHKIPPNKLLLGLPFYGRHYSTDKMGQPFPKGGRYTGEQINYADIAPLAASGDYRTLWDNGGHISYLEKNGGGHTVSFDNEKALTEKISYAKDKGFAGVFIWALGTDLYGGRPVLLDTVGRAVGAPPEEPPVDYLKKYYETKISDAKKIGQEIVKAQGELVRLDKGKEHKMYDPLRAFVGISAAKSDRKGLEVQIDKAEKLIYQLKSKMDEVDAKLDGLPLSLRTGKAVKAEGPTFLIADFEDGSIAHKLGGNWDTEYDQNKLGTTLNPSPLKLAAGGYKGSKHSLRIWGHFGKSGAPPWPYADVGATMVSSDLSPFKSIRFAAKGNGKKYMVVLRRGAVRDYGHFRAQFPTTNDWTQVELKFEDFAQPDWAHPLQKGWVDVTSIAFMPDVLFSDEDYDLSIDNVELVK